MKRKQWLALTLVVILAGAFSLVPAEARTPDPGGGGARQPQATSTVITVTTTADELVDDGYCSLREAVEAANCDCPVDVCPAGSGKDTIVLEYETYLLDLEGPGEDANQTGDLDIHDDVRIESPTRLTEIDGNETDRVFHVHSGALELVNLTVTHGRAYYGGGILNNYRASLDNVGVVNNVSIAPNFAQGGGIWNGGPLSIDNSDIGGNHAECTDAGCESAGGGIYNSWWTMTIQATSVSGNSVVAGGRGEGGGIANEHGDLTIALSLIKGNGAVTGGGIDSTYGDLHIATSIIDNNGASEFGGGILVMGSDVTLADSTVSNNTSGGDGGGIGVHIEGHARLTNTTVSGNSASALGGGIYFYNSSEDWASLELANLSITANEAVEGSGFYVLDESDGDCVDVSNSLIALNPIGGDCVASGHAPIDLGYNHVGDGNCGFPPAGDPVVGPLQDNGGPRVGPSLYNPIETHALLTGSPAMDQGDCSGGTVTQDQRGVARPQDGDGAGGAACDIGAYEHRLASVLFDEAHDEWKTLDEARADELCPGVIPWCEEGDEDYVLFTGLQAYLADEFVLDRNADQPLTGELLGGYDALMLTVHQEALTPDEVAAVRQYVAQGGGLIWIGDCGWDNPNPGLAASFGLEFRPQCLFRVPPPPPGGDPDGDLGALVYAPHEANRFSSGHSINWGASLDRLDGAADVAFTGIGVWEDTDGSGDYTPPPEGEDRFGLSFLLAAAHDAGCGRVVALSDDAYSNTFLGGTDINNEDYMRSLLRWVTGGPDCEVPCRATGWTQSAGDGFGDGENWGVLSFVEHDGELLAGTGNDTGAQMWDLDSAWGPYTDYGGSGGVAADNIGVNHLYSFADQTYNATWNETAGGHMWRSVLGQPDIWNLVVNDGFGDPDNAEIMRLAEFREMLYAGTWKYGGSGAGVWGSADGQYWWRANIDGFGDADNASVLTLSVARDHLYAGTFNEATGGEVWRTLDNKVWVQVNDDGFGSAANRGVSAIEEFRGWLYAITTGTDGAQPAQVWRCTKCSQGDDWQVVVDGGFGDIDNAGLSGLEVYQGALYAFVGNDSTGLQVWRTDNGTDWRRSGPPGFGSASNIATYWDNPIYVFDESLWAGTLNFATGGEVWQSVCMDDAVHLPVVLRQ